MAAVRIGGLRIDPRHSALRLAPMPRANAGRDAPRPIAERH